MSTMRLWESLKWDKGEAERFEEEEVEPEFQDAEEGATREDSDSADTRAHESGAFHGEFGSATLRECLDRINQRGIDAPAPCQSGVKIERTPNPPQVMSPNVGEEQIPETISAARPSQDHESQPRIKEERKEEEVTPKSEAVTVGTKDEPAEQGLQRLIAEFPPSADPTPQQHNPEQREGATAPDQPWEFDGPYAPRRSTQSPSRVISPDPLMFHNTIWLEHDREANAHEEPVTQIRAQLFTMQANLETLRTRLDQIADLRDAQVKDCVGVKEH